MAAGSSTPDVIWVKPTIQGYVMVVAAVVLIFLSLLAGVAGSGGSVEGFIAACATNPLVWLMIGAAFPLFGIGKEYIQGISGLKWRCPHCGEVRECDEQVKNAAVGQVFSCCKCKNDVRKGTMLA